MLEFRADMSMTDAVQFPKEDLNGDRCGLIRLGLVIPDAIFEGDIISSEYKDGEWWIYMPKGSNWLTIKSKRHVPLHCEFEEIQSNVTYIMVVVEITGSGGKPMPTQQYLVFQLSPTNAVLEVNGQLWEVGSDGTAMKFVDFGTYSYRVQAPNYLPETGKVTVNDPNDAKTVNVKLKSDFVEVTLKVDADAEIWVNNEKKGTRTWTGLLGKGTYKIECKQVNHETSMFSKEITAEMNGQTITLPVPKPIYGSLNVESTPVGATIYIDGKEVGRTPRSINEILVGQHEIKLIKEDYAEYSELVTIAKGERKQVKATLNKKAEDTQPIATTPSNGHSDLTFTVGGVNFTMKLVEGGTFQMGAQRTNSSGQNYIPYVYSSESPVHSVTLSTFYMGETEVTQALWQAVMGSNPSYFKGGNLPVERVSWNDCQEFIRKLNQKTDRNFRLPTEAEWEYAARGGKKSNRYKYAGSDVIGNVAWYHDNSRIQTHPVATKSPNELGLYDMSGNVWEWCSDKYDSYSSGSQTNPQGSFYGSTRVLRGGSWCDFAVDCRVSIRGNDGPGYTISNYGFRLVLSQ